MIDVRSGEWVAIDYLRDEPKDSRAGSRRHGSYGVIADSKNNFYGLELGGGLRHPGGCQDAVIHFLPDSDS